MNYEYNVPRDIELILRDCKLIVLKKKKMYITLQFAGCGTTHECC